MEKYCVVYEVEFNIGGGRQIIEIFNVIQNGNLLKAFITALPIHIGDNYFRRPIKEIWNNLIDKVKDKLGEINFIIFRNVTIDQSEIDKSLINALWCTSMGDVDYRLPSKQLTIDCIHKLEELYIHNKSINDIKSSTASLIEIGQKLLQILADYPVELVL